MIFDLNESNVDYPRVKKKYLDDWQDSCNVSPNDHPTRRENERRYNNNSPNTSRINE